MANSSSAGSAGDRAEPSSRATRWEVAGPVFVVSRRAYAAEAALCYPQPMDYRPYITIEPGKRGGKPCIRGLRITVYDVLEYLSSGMSVDDIVSDFPDLTLR